MTAVRRHHHQLHARRHLVVQHRPHTDHTRVRLDRRVPGTVSVPVGCFITDSATVILFVVSVTGRPLQVTVHPALRDRCPVLSCPVCLSVCNIGVLWPNGWMDQDTISYGSRPRRRRHVLDGDPAPPRKGTQQLPHFSAHVILAHDYCGETVAHLSYC